MTRSAEPKPSADLPDPDKVRAWAELIPTAPERILQEIEAEGRHLRRKAMLCLWFAIAVFFASLAAIVYLARIGAAWPATGAAGAGAVTVAVTLITGQAPRINRRGVGVR